MAIKPLAVSTMYRNILSSLMLTIKKAVEQYLADNQHCTEDCDTTKKVLQNPYPYAE